MLKIMLTLVILSLSSEAMSKSIVLNNVTSLSKVEKVIDQEQPASSDKVLVIFDIDDTLLKSDNFFGG
ncbi:MAG: DUF2608 domain-containing protein, partial [Pseudomonadales bacterium]|nr:DUF2608 domain-containing protein [Pseudomonadales bacterium]